MVDLGTLGGTNSVAQGVNADGSVVVGTADTASVGVNHAFRWTAGTNTMVDLGTLGGTLSSAYGVNADGSVVVGTATTTNDAAQRAFRWTQASGMISVDDWLRSQGVTLTNDVTQSANGVSANGNVIVGQLENNHAFIARGATTVTTAGLMDVSNFQQSLVSVPRVSGQLQNADMAVNGAHSSPLFMLLDAGNPLPGLPETAAMPARRRRRAGWAPANLASVADLKTVGQCASPAAGNILGWTRRTAAMPTSRQAISHPTCRMSSAAISLPRSPVTSIGARPTSAVAISTVLPMTAPSVRLQRRPTVFALASTGRMHSTRLDRHLALRQLHLSEFADGRLHRDPAAASPSVSMARGKPRTPSASVPMPRPRSPTI